MLPPVVPCLQNRASNLLISANYLLRGVLVVGMTNAIKVIKVLGESKPLIANVTIVTRKMAQSLLDRY